MAVFLLTFYVISQVFEIKMDASLGNLFGKFHFFPFLKFYFLLVVCKLLPVINIESSLSRKEDIIISISVIP